MVTRSVLGWLLAVATVCVRAMEVPGSSRDRVAERRARRTEQRCKWRQADRESAHSKIVASANRFRDTVRELRSCYQSTNHPAPLPFTLAAFPLSSLVRDSAHLRTLSLEHAAYCVWWRCYRPYTEHRGDHDGRNVPGVTISLLAHDLLSRSEMSLYFF